MINVLMISKWHVHAQEYAQVVIDYPTAKITCVWDENPERGAKWACELGAEFEPCLDKALAREDVDVVVVDSATTAHKEIIIKAANAKKHIFTEKALAPTVAECEEIAKAVNDNGVKFIISYPKLTLPLVQFCKEVIDSGKLGKIHFMRHRNAHDGSLAGWLPDYWFNMEQAAGGAMMDLGCHSMYMASYFLGKPARITSMFNTNVCPAPAEDNAVSVIEFENKAIAVLETSLISPFDEGHLEIRGTEGYILAVGDSIKVRTNDMPEVTYTPNNLPVQLPKALAQLFDSIENGTPIRYDMEAAIKLTRLLENAYISHNEQRTVAID